MGCCQLGGRGLCFMASWWAGPLVYGHQVGRGLWFMIIREGGASGIWSSGRAGPLVCGHPGGRGLCFMAGWVGPLVYGHLGGRGLWFMAGWAGPLVSGHPGGRGLWFLVSWVGGASALCFLWFRVSFIIPLIFFHLFSLFFSPLHLPVCPHPDAPTTTPTPTTTATTTTAITIPSTSSSLEALPGTVSPSHDLLVLPGGGHVAWLAAQVADWTVENRWCETS